MAILQAPARASLHEQCGLSHERGALARHPSLIIDDHPIPIAGQHLTHIAAANRTAANEDAAGLEARRLQTRRPHRLA